MVDNHDPIDDQSDGAHSPVSSKSSRLRFISNIRSGNRKVQARKRAETAFRISWKRFSFVVASMVAIAALVLDQPVGAYRDQWPHYLRLIAVHMTDFGKSGWILIPTGVFILVMYALDWSRWAARSQILRMKLMVLCGYLFFTIAVGGLIATTLKRLFGRARPTHFQDVGAFEFAPIALDASYASFPSGHSTTIGGLFAAIALLFPKSWIICLILAVWFGTTRILVGAHYPSDVIAGLSFGAWFSYFSAILFARHGLLFSTSSKGWPARRQGFQPFINPILRRYWSKTRI